MISGWISLFSRARKSIDSLRKVSRLLPANHALPRCVIQMSEFVSDAFVMSRMSRATSTAARRGFIEYEIRPSCDKELASRRH